MSKVEVYLGNGGRSLKTDLAACFIRGCCPAGVPSKPVCSLEMADLAKLIVLYLNPELNILRRYFTIKATLQVKGFCDSSKQNSENFFHAEPYPLEEPDEM